MRTLVRTLTAIWDAEKTTVRDDPIMPSYDRKTSVGDAIMCTVSETVSRTESERTYVWMKEAWAEKLTPAGSADSVGAGVPVADGEKGRVDACGIKVPDPAKVSEPGYAADGVRRAVPLNGKEADKRADRVKAAEPPNAGDAENAEVR
jgi:hypothetical protein